MVSLVSQSLVWLYRVEGQLSSEGIATTCLHGYHHLLVGSTNPVVVAHVPNLPIGLALSVPSAARIVLITRADPENLRHLSSISVDDVLFEGEEATELPAVLTRFPEHDLGLVFEIVLRRDFPPLLRSAVRLLLRQTGWRERGTPARSLSAASAVVGCSPRYLGRLAHTAGIDIRSLIDLSLGLRAVAEKQSGASWETVARRLGYSSGSGLVALFLRLDGKRPTEVPLEYWRQRCLRGLEVVLEAECA